MPNLASALHCSMQTVTWYKKVYVIYNFFLIRKIIAHIITFSFYCLILPATCWIPEVVIPKWGAVYIPVIITVLNAAGTPRSNFSNFVHSSVLLLHSALTNDPRIFGSN